jgi:hypothetical protein
MDRVRAAGARVAHRRGGFGWLRRAAPSFGCCAVAALVLCGCASGAGEAPLSGSRRAAIRTELLDSAWAGIAADYPEAIRPKITMAPTVPDHDWAAEVVSCLASTGIVATEADGGVHYGSGSGRTQLEVAVEFYSCEAGHPAESQVAAKLTKKQSAALYDYYIDLVRPCLLSVGAPSPASPDRSAVEGLAGLAGYNPYQVIWTSGMSRQSVSYLESRCPPVPPWLNLEPQAAGW